jgi:hypothetical protein
VNGALTLTVVEGENGLHKDGNALARVIVSRRPSGSRCIALVFGPDDTSESGPVQREAYAKIFAASPEFASAAQRLLKRHEEKVRSEHPDAIYTCFDCREAVAVLNLAGVTP